MRCFAMFALLAFLLGGCTELMRMPVTSVPKPSFHKALVELTDKHQPAEMVKLAKGSDKTLAADAQRALALYKDACEQKETAKQVATLREENRQLQKKLDELSELHLELDRRMP